MGVCHCHSTEPRNAGIISPLLQCTRLLLSSDICASCGEKARHCWLSKHGSQLSSTDNGIHSKTRHSVDTVGYSGMHLHSILWYTCYSRAHSPSTGHVGLILPTGAGIGQFNGIVSHTWSVVVIHWSSKPIITGGENGRHTVDHDTFLVVKHGYIFCQKAMYNSSIVYNTHATH